MAQYNLPTDILDIIKGLDSRLTNMEKLVQSGSTSIDDGALEVRQAGVTKVKVGKLDDGSFGLAVYDPTGKSLPLSQLAFGIKAARYDPSVTPPNNVWTLDANVLVTNVTVTNNRMIVVVSAQINAGSGGQGTPADAYYGWGASGAQAIAPSFQSSLYARYTGLGMQNTVQASWWDVVTGIANGTYQVQCYMYGGTIGSPSNSSDFANKRLTVLPY